MIKFKLAVFICILSCSPVVLIAQEINTSINKVIRINSIEDGNEDYSDLAFLKELWKDKKYIFLGEQSHGDGATFEGRNRLIKFLHQKMDFEIIAFESGLFDNFHASEEVKTNPNSSAFSNSILGIWSETKEIDSLITYIKKSQSTRKPLMIAGFDYFRSVQYKEYFWEEVKAGLATVLNNNELSFLEKIILGNPEELYNQPSLLATFNQIGTKGQSYFQKSITKNGSISNKILAQSFYTWLQDVNYEVQEASGTEFFVQNPRDRLMAENFKFLTELYPDKKIIAIGASYHFANQVTAYKNTDFTSNYIQKLKADQPQNNNEEISLDGLLKGAVPMGSILKEQFGEQMYSLAFTALAGKYGIVNDQVFEIHEGPQYSLEKHIDMLGHNYAVIDLKKQEHAMFYASPLGHLPILATWDKVFDGFFFTKDSYPPHEKEYELPKSNNVKTTNKNAIYGSTLDEISKTVIPYANIALIGTSNGVSSNADGEFIISIPLKPTDQLVVSSIGYQNDTIQVKDIGDKSNFIISLKPRNYLLNEVKINSKPLTPKEILKLAKQKIDDNYYQKEINQEFYYTSSNYVNDSLRFNEDATILVYGNKGYQSSNTPWNQFYGEILQFRNTTGNVAKGKHYHEGTRTFYLMFVHDIILDKSNVLHRTNGYDLSLDDIVEFNDQLVYKIGFKAKNPNAYNTGYGYPAPSTAHGTIYIGMTDFAVTKFDVCISRQTTEFRNKKKRKKYDYEFNYDKTHHLTQIYKKYQGKYHLHTSIRQNESTTTRLDNGFIIKSSEYNILSTSALRYNDLTIIKRPIDKLKISKDLMKDNSFWDTHAQLPPLSKNKGLKCAEH